MHVERTFTVSRPIEEVFAYLSDFTHTTEWDPGTLHTERTSGDGGLGTTWANTSKFLGRRVQLSYTTITFQPPTRVQFRGLNGGAVGTDSMTFTATADGGTSIHYRADFTFGRLVTAASPLLRRPLERLADTTVEQIRRRLA